MDILNMTESSEEQLFPLRTSRSQQADQLLHASPSMSETTLQRKWIKANRETYVIHENILKIDIQSTLL